MTEFVTDLGTLELLANMTQDGADKLEAFLKTCDKGYQNRITISGFLFENQPKLRWMEMEYNPNDRRKGRVLTSVFFQHDAIWRRGSLRIKGIELPQTLMTGIKGRRIGDLVENAPFPDFIISHAIHDRKAGEVTLRIRSSGETLAPIPRR